VHCVRAGELLAVDNRGLHCRTAFDDATAAPAAPRWMTRTFVGSERHIAHGVPIIDPRSS
jgi:hypothetical protein